MYILAIFCPPLAVLLKGKPVAAFTNCLLTLCFWVPGIIHAWIVIGQANQDKRTDRIINSMKNNG